MEIAEDRKTTMFHDFLRIRRVDPVAMDGTMWIKMVSRKPKIRTLNVLEKEDSNPVTPIPG